MPGSVRQVCPALTDLLISERSVGVVYIPRELGITLDVSPYQLVLVCP